MISTLRFSNLLRLVCSRRRLGEALGKNRFDTGHCTIYPKQPEQAPLPWTFPFALSPSYSFALPTFPSPRALFTSSQQIPATGPISSPNFFASKLLACLTAYRLAIPWKITLSRHIANAVLQASSGAGSQPATSAYHVMTCEREGIPGTCKEEEGEAAKGGEALRRVESKEVYVQGAMRLERSDRG